MKLLKSKILLFSLFFTHHVSAWDLSENQKLNLILSAGYVSMGTISAATAYMMYSCNIPDKFYVKNKYSYAQIWYNEMAVKYPDAQLDQYTFLSAQRGFCSNYVTWQCTFHEIYAHRADLDALEDIYKKKAASIELSEQEILVLNILEFLLLDVAGLAKHNVFVKSLIADSIAFPIALATVDLCIIRNLVTSPSAKIEPAVAMFEVATAFTMTTLGYFSYIKHQVVQADKFACQQAADVDVLRGGLKFFNHLRNNGMISFVHPSLDSRIQMVLDEIERRSQKDAILK